MWTLGVSFLLTENRELRNIHSTKLPRTQIKRDIGNKIKLYIVIVSPERIT